MDHCISSPAQRRRKGFFHQLSQLFSLQQQRRKLATYDDRILDDIGIDRATAEAEAARPIWDVPQTWLR